jgi:hypothetical protein
MMLQATIPQRQASSLSDWPPVPRIIKSQEEEDKEQAVKPNDPEENRQLFCKEVVLEIDDYITRLS